MKIIFTWLGLRFLDLFQIFLPRIDMLSVMAGGNERISLLRLFTDEKSKMSTGPFKKF